MTMPPADEEEEEERVPLFGTWRNAYGVVVAVLVVDILVLYAATRLLA